jgi:hypothetical protein
MDGKRFETYKQMVVSWMWAIFDLVMLFLVAYLFWGGR